jgi:hypothetical protein
MNKKTFLILAIAFAMALPSAALAKAEFSLGGYIKLDAFWDSTQEGKNMNGAIVRNNSGVTTLNTNINQTAFHHGRLHFTSQSSRFNFTIKGPKLWGATTTGFFEMDMDAAEEGAASSGRDTNTAGTPFIIRGGATSASNSYQPRLRHAMFRLDWPETQLLFGQYWSMFSQWYPELLQDGPFQMTGTPTARLPQIRLTQKFAGAWQVAALIGDANGITNGQSYSLVDRNGGESAEAPQVQIQGQFQQDLWGKAAWYGKPTPFTAQLTAGWQRGVIQQHEYFNAGGYNNQLFTTGQDNYGRAPGITRHQYLDPWMVAGSLFIPVIPTHSANLAGTAALQTSWWIGQGVEAFGFGGFGSQVFRWQGMNAFGQDVYQVDLMNRFGGQVAAQYYFTNQWFTTAAWGFSKAFGVGAFETDNNAPNNRSNAFGGDAVNYHHELDLALWYRPIQAFKFGLQYAYARTNFFQNTTVGSVKTNLGEAHRVEFVGLFFF